MSSIEGLQLTQPVIPKAKNEIDRALLAGRVFSSSFHFTFYLSDPAPARGQP